MGLNVKIVNPRVNLGSNAVIDVCEARDYLDGTLNKSDATKLATLVYDFLTESFHEVCGNIKYCFIWNGSDVIDKALAKYCKDNNINTIYLEISNLPNRLFLDALGVNAASSLMQIDDVDVLRYIKPSISEDFDGFLKEFKKEKSGEYVPKQSKLMSKINYAFIFDYIFSLMKGYRFQSRGLKEKLKNAVSRHSYKKISLGNKLDLRSKYFFLPLQVSNDSQILLNSDVSNCDAIRYAADKAKANHCKLYVKVHPAEKDIERVSEYKVLQSELGFDLVTNNTNELINSADKVYTINSTVGLEAILLGKEVCFLGRTVFKLFSKKNIDLYVNNFLFDCDYFGKDTIVVDKIVSHYLELKRVINKDD